MASRSDSLNCSPSRQLDLAMSNICLIKSHRKTDKAGSKDGDKHPLGCLNFVWPQAREDGTITHLFTNSKVSKLAVPLVTLLRVIAFTILTNDYMWLTQTTGRYS